MLNYVEDTKSVAQSDATDESATPGTIRPNIVWPEEMWWEVKKAAAEGRVSAAKFVVDLVAEHLKRAS